MIIQIPFKEKCRDFWSLNNALDNEIKDRPSIKVIKGKTNFNQKEKCFKCDDFNTVMEIQPEDIKAKNISLIFQTKKIQIKDNDMCNIFSFVKNDEIKMSINLEQYGDYFYINSSKKRSQNITDTVIPIKLLSLDKWSTNVFIFDYENKQIKYYINSVLAYVTNIEETVDMRMSSLCFNKNLSCGGSIRNIGIYNSAFSYEEIKKLLFHNYYKKLTTSLWLKFIEFLYKNKKEMIPWI